MISFLNAKLCLQKAIKARTNRQKLKSWIAARNRKIEALHAKTNFVTNPMAWVADFKETSQAKQELDSIRSESRLYIQSCTIIQSWWRGCRQRGYKSRAKERKRNPVQDWMDSVGNSIRETTEKWDKDNPCYPWTKVRKYTLRKA